MLSFLILTAVSSATPAMPLALTGELCTQGSCSPLSFTLQADGTATEDTQGLGSGTWSSTRRGLHLVVESDQGTWEFREDHSHGNCTWGTYRLVYLLADADPLWGSWNVCY